jgi:hypothetical protein
MIVFFSITRLSQSQAERSDSGGHPKPEVTLSSDENRRLPEPRTAPAAVAAVAAAATTNNESSPASGRTENLQNALNRRESWDRRSSDGSVAGRKSSESPATAAESSFSSRVDFRLGGSSAAMGSSSSSLDTEGAADHGSSLFHSLQSVDYVQVWRRTSVGGSPDPCFFGPPGSVSISQRYGSGSGSFPSLIILLAK